MRARQIADVLIAFLFGSVVSALVIAYWLPLPPGAVSVWSFLGQLMLLTVLGPLMAAWALGPGPLSIPVLMLALAVPTTVVAVLVLGYFRRGSVSALVSASLLWNVFGGFCAYVAVAGSI